MSLHTTQTNLPKSCPKHELRSVSNCNETSVEWSLQQLFQNPGQDPRENDPGDITKHSYIVLLLANDASTSSTHRILSHILSLSELDWKLHGAGALSFYAFGKVQCILLTVLCKQ